MNPTNSWSHIDGVVATQGSSGETCPRLGTNEEAFFDLYYPPKHGGRLDTPPPPTLRVTTVTKSSGFSPQDGAP